MNRRSIIHLLPFLFLTLSCVKSARDLTYPPDFRYIEGKQLRSTMWQLAFITSNLNRELKTPDASSAEYRKKILQHLSDMEKVAGSLGSGQQVTNHPFLNRNLSVFLTDIAAAKMAASHESPNYIPAGQVSSACQYCHARPN